MERDRLSPAVCLIKSGGWVSIKMSSWADGSLGCSGEGESLVLLRMPKAVVLEPALGSVGI